jgi:hypothetical protein
MTRSSSTDTPASPSPLPEDANTNGSLESPLLGEHKEEDENNRLLHPNGEGFGILHQLADNNIDVDELHRVFNELTNEAWFNDLYNMSELPEKYDIESARANMETALAIYCVVAASILYYLGGDKLGKMYIIGGLAVNLLQTFFFTKQSLRFISKIEDKTTLAAISGFFALFSTIVTSIATYQLSDSGPKVALVEAVLNFSGMLPQNIYGMFASIKRVLDHYHDSPLARQHLMNELRQIVDENSFLKNAIEPDRSMFNSILNQMAGVIAGLALSASQVGYIRSSVSFMVGHTNEHVGLALGLLTNLPGLGISMFVSGKALAEKIVNNVFDWGNYAVHKIRGQPVPDYSERDKLFLSAKVVAALGVGALAHYSSATSLMLYDRYSPIPIIPSNSFFDAIIKVAIDEGVQVFNGVMAIMAIDEALDYINKAYVTAPSHDEIKMKIQQMVQSIKTMPADKVEELAVKAGWIRPVSMAVARHNLLFREAPEPTNTDDETDTLTADDYRQLESGIIPAMP